MRIFDTYEQFKTAEGMDLNPVPTKDWFDWVQDIRNESGLSHRHTYGWKLTLVSHRSVARLGADGHGWLIAREHAGNNIEDRARTGRVALFRRQWHHDQNEAWSERFAGRDITNPAVGSRGKEMSVDDIDRILPGERLD